MSHFNIDAAVNVNSNFLSYDYPSCVLFNKGQWDKRSITDSALGYYAVTFPSCKDAKLLYNDNNVFYNYVPSYMYIFNVLHNNIDGLTDGEKKNKDIIGELVIEHESSTNTNKLFLCILLKKVSNSLGADSTVDSVLSMIDSVQYETTNTEKYRTSAEKFSLSVDIPDQKQQKCIIYKSSINTVIVLTEPMLVNSNSELIIKNLTTNPDNLFNISAPNDYAETTKTAQQSDAKAPRSTIDGYDGKDDIYIDCRQTGASSKEMHTLNVPLGSEFADEFKKMDFMKTSVNFFLFSLALVFVYFFVPMVYKKVVIDSAIKGFIKESDAKTKNIIRAADVLICMVFLAYIIYSFYYGFKGEGDYTMMTNGLFGVVLLGISYTLIQIKKLEVSFLTNNDTQQQSESYNQTNEKNIDAVNFGYIFLILGSVIDFIKKPNVLSTLVVVYIIILIILLILMSVGQIPRPEFMKHHNQFVFYLIFAIPLIMFLAGS
jgi:hypothetical protein